MNSHRTPTASFIANTEWQFPAGACEDAITAAVGAERHASFDAEQVAVQLLGDSIYTNPLMLGFAWQHGRIPLSREALLQAMVLNGVQVEKNQAAFEWGRRCAHDLAAVQALFAAQQVIQIVKKPSVDEVIAKRVNFLTAYQDAAYAQRYSAFVQRVRTAEGSLNSTRLTDAVARYLFKLMAYKDEYEVARLHTDGSFAAKIAGMFEGDVTLVHHLAPPMFAKTSERGELLKKPYGPWVRTAFAQLAKLKGLRGTAFDVFGRSEERRTERALIGEYQQSVEELLNKLSAERLALAVEIASLPEDIRGFGHVKARHIAAVRPKWQVLMARWRENPSAGT
jgi:indolepyruvate ferredoxin oxidoreductase